jgi:hypothetical protein
VGSETQPPSIEYGVFRSLKHSCATSAEESVKSYSGTDPILFLRNRGHLVVEMFNSRGDSFTASFTSTSIKTSEFGSDIAKLSQAATSDLEDKSREGFLRYIQRMLGDILQHCHGTLIAVYRSSSESVPPDFSDGVWLAAPLDIAAVHAQAVAAKDAESLATLQSLESLLRGMIDSDGVVVLGTSGNILGYRVFLKPSDDEKKAASHKGGGRRRTYELMKSRLNSSLRAAFFRSQDGDTECEVAK